FGQINDFQTTVTECDSTLRPNPRAVGTPRRHDGSHCCHRRYIGCTAVESHLTGGSTHLNNPTEIDVGVRAADRLLPCASALRCAFVPRRDSLSVCRVVLTTALRKALQLVGVLVLHLEVPTPVGGRGDADRRPVAADAVWFHEQL